MPVAAQTVSQSIIAAAGQTVFPFTFRCDDAATLEVFINDALQGVPGIALNADQIGNPGGNITLAPQAAGAVVTIERDAPITQTTAFGAYQAFPSSAVGVSLDRVVMLIQEAWSYLSRAIRVPRSWKPKVPSVELPPPVVGSAIGWGDAGGGNFNLVNLPGGGGGGSGAGTQVVGEALVDTGDHIHFNFGHLIRAGSQAVYRTGQRVFNPADYTLATVGLVTQLTLLVALVPASGERLDADYSY